jgi:hypothetical protein
MDQEINMVNNLKKKKCMERRFGKKKKKKKKKKWRSSGETKGNGCSFFSRGLLCQLLFRTHFLICKTFQ